MPGEEPHVIGAISKANAPGRGRSGEPGPAPGPSGTQARGPQQGPGACLRQCGPQPLAASAPGAHRGVFPTPIPTPRLSFIAESSLPERKPRAGRQALSYGGCWSRGRGCRRVPRALPQRSRPRPPAPRVARARVRGGRGGRGGARWRPAPTPRPLPRRLTGRGHLPQPMSASQGGPWNAGLRLLRVAASASAVGNQNPVGTVPVDRAPQPGDPQAEGLRAGRPTAPSARGRAEPPQPHAPPRTHLPPLPPQYPWGPGDFKGVWGFGSREITGTERRLSLPWRRFLFDGLDPVPGRRERDWGAESGLPTQSTRTPTGVHRAGFPFLPLPLCSVILDRAASPWRSPIDCAGAKARSQGRSAPGGQMCRAGV